MADQQIDGVRRAPVYYYLFLASLALLMTASTVQYSMRCGRLAIPPGWDDVGYMCDSARRLDVFWREGVVAEVLLYIHNPPHSPWSELLGMIGFAIFGLRDWAAYAMNFTVVFGYLLFANYLLGNAKIWQKLICFVFLLAMPIIPESVAEFRPDHACSLFTVIACMLTVEQSITRAGARRLALIGAMFGLAMFTKPSTFPAVVILMFACLVMSTVADLVGDKIPFSFKNFSRTWGLVIGAAVIVGLLYFSVGLREIWNYIHENMFGQYKDVWKYKGNFRSALLYDLNGAGGQVQLGDNLFLLLTLLGIGGIYSTITGSRAEKARMTALTFLLLGTFMMAVLNHMKSPFTGLTFQTCLVLMAVRVLAFILTKPSDFPWLFALVACALISATIESHWQGFFALFDRHVPVKTFRATPIFYDIISACAFTIVLGGGWYLAKGSLNVRWSPLVVAFATLVAVIQFQWPQSCGDYNGDLATSRRRMANGVYNTIIEHITPGHNRVLIQGIGDVNPPLLTYMTIKDQRNVVFYSPNDSDQLEPVMAEWNNFDLIIASEQEPQITADFNMRFHTLDALLAKLKQRSDWRQIGFIPYVFTGKGYYIFEKVGR